MVEDGGGTESCRGTKRMLAALTLWFIRRQLEVWEGLWWDNIWESGDVCGVLEEHSIGTRWSGVRERLGPGTVIKTNAIAVLLVLDRGLGADVTVAESFQGRDNIPEEHVAKVSSISGLACLVCSKSRHCQHRREDDRSRSVDESLVRHMLLYQKDEGNGTTYDTNSSGRGLCLCIQTKRFVS
jgi:hypothetical protein